MPETAPVSEIQPVPDELVPEKDRVPGGEATPRTDPVPEIATESAPLPHAPVEPEPPGEWMTVGGVAYRCVVLCFLFRSRGGGREVLLGLKRTGFGTGRVVALGGKIDGRESAVEAAVREVAEESGIELGRGELRDAGCITWSFPAQPAWNMAAFLFTADAGSKPPVASEEIEPRWYAVDGIPWTGMWQDAPYWIPALLEGRRIDAHIVMDSDNEGVASAVVD
ncbi:8-oxo-dGTP diphosphatase [Arthrobacter sedimenti]|uniref:8-oxo-dGTP diphosphatase n=1 Tax=Arthrobacter sedimenti TaxID=2694931 RepID=UPI001CDC6FA1|nr:NUDIX domain-containing protein [Arthrobacter sedimenti]